MDNEISQLKNEILCLREAIEWLTYELANNNNWVGFSNKEITTREFESNREGFYNRLKTIIGKEATWQREVTNG